MIEFLPSHKTTSMEEEPLLIHEQRKWFLEIKSTPSEDALKIVEIDYKEFRILHKQFIK